MQDCTLCPRRCHADRISEKPGFCGQGAEITAARAALHFWEEPCISGSCGSGTVFFSGCSLQCVYCQNRQIALGRTGRSISLERLAEIFLELQEKKAANINLVTAGHFLPQVAYSLELAKQLGLTLPVVYNTGSYEEVSSLRMLEGLVDIYLPDLKYRSPELSAKYSNAPDYFEKAAAAIEEMYRQTGSLVFDPETGLMKRGVIVRHLLLPGQSRDSKQILRYLHNTYKNDISVSIMNQFTPLADANLPQELNRRVTTEEYDKILSFGERIGIEQGYYQEGETAAESFIPPFDCEGI
ncbi:MAG: radical SAM protein [Acetatifactor sp.]|nr:radical SAM protein [Acetatifactor sp.]